MQQIEDLKVELKNVNANLEIETKKVDDLKAIQIMILKWESIQKYNQQKEETKQVHREMEKLEKDKD